MQRERERERGKVTVGGREGKEAYATTTTSSPKEEVLW
jgi:hypothetical protein